MYNILEEPTVYRDFSTRDLYKSQENFEDFMKEYLTFLGYDNLKYVTTHSFLEKSAMMKKIMIRDMCQIAICEEDDEIAINSPFFKIAYNDVLNSFVYVFGKYFYFNITPMNLFEKIYPILNRHFGEIIHGDGDSMIDILYYVLEPYFAELKSDYVENNGYLMKSEIITQ